MSPGSAWAAGQTLGESGPDQALIEHWDGTRWSVTPAASYGAHSLLLYSAGGSSDMDLWVAGDAQNNLTVPLNLVERRSAGQWVIQNTVNAGVGENHFYGIASEGGVSYAVGGYAPSVNGALNTIIERHDSSGWTQEVTPSPGKQFGNSLVGGIAIVGPSDVWAVGAYDGPNAAHSLVLHRCR